VQRAVVTVTQEAIRVCGGRAFLRRYPLERYARDARAAALMRQWTQEIARDTAGLGGGTWLGQAAGRCRRGVTLTSVGCEKDGAALPPLIATPRVDAVASPQAQRPPCFERRSICATPAASLPAARRRLPLWLSADTGP
jgi:hypothetical protein